MSNPLIQILDRTGKNQNAPLEPEVSKPLDLAAVRANLASKNGRAYWRSLEELAGDDEFNRFLEREFPRQAPRDMAPLARRDFLKLMGASLALAGVSGCAFQPTENIVGYVNAPEDMIPGVPQFYATAMTMGGYAIGLLAESNMGRPTKIEGNPSHPSSLGATDIYAQASILNLYDPARSKAMRKLRDNVTWEDFTGAVQELAEQQLAPNNGEGFHLLTETITSPTLVSQIAQLQQAFPRMQWHQYEPNTRDGARAGAQQAFGGPTHLVYHFDRADRVLSLDANFLGDEPGSVRYARDFSDRRRARAGTQNINRMYMVESTPTITGAVADHRLAVSGSQVQAIAQALAAKLGAPGVNAPTLNAAQQTWVDACATDLQSARGRVVAIAGGHQSAEVHVLAHAINSALGALNTTVTGHEAVEVVPQTGGAAFQQTQSISALAQAIDNGSAKVVLMLGGNPAFSAPADVKFGERLEKAVLRQRNPLVAIHLSIDDNETSANSTWHIPETHYLESWGDARGHDGTVSIVQPLIQPLYPQARNAHEVLGAFQTPTSKGVNAQPNALQPQYNPDRSAMEIVQGYWMRTRGNNSNASLDAGATDQAGAGITAMDLNTNAGDAASAITAFEKQWQTWLHDGIVPNSAAAPKTLSFVGNVGALNAPNAGAIEALFRPDPTIWDGRFLNNAWLQELPKPLTKITWDNTVLMPLSMAEKLGVTDDDLVNVKLKNAETFVQLPVTIQPGHPENCVTVHYGYGRTRAGAVGNETGRDVLALRSAQNMNWAPVEVSAAGGSYRIARTAHHNVIDPRDNSIDGLHERALIQSATIEQFAKNPKSVVGRKAIAGLPVVGLTQQGKINTGVEEDGTDAGHASDHPGEEKAPGFPSLYSSGRDSVLNDEAIPYAWGMSIDTSTCIGCNACVIACQSENNSAVTGKDQVMIGREMHWLRIDTYYHGDVNDPDVYFQPVMCMHCEKAPCEPVCPVMATEHSPEGINEMVYNRCIGTRYCSNNCPYKVRRFNFLQYSEQNTPQMELMANPDVTVRARGVMEKCNYCIQRVQEAKIQAEKEDRTVRDGEIVTACQQSCPTNAIIFGDIRNAKSQVAQLKQQPHTYGMLTELNTYPRTTYLAKIHNPNPQIKRAEEKDDNYLHPADNPDDLGKFGVEVD